MIRPAPPALAAGVALAAALLALVGSRALPLRTPATAPCEGPVEIAAALGDRAAAPAVRCDGGQGPGPRGPARLLFGERLDPNHASAAALEVLPGVGPARAAAIVRERASRPFGSVDDLRRVPGIGPATLARVRDWLAVADRRGERPAADPIGAPPSAG